MREEVVAAYAGVLRLVRLLPREARPYYARFARENFVTYNNEVDQDTIRMLLRRAYDHSCWVLHKYGVNKDAANKLRKICCKNIESNVCSLHKTYVKKNNQIGTSGWVQSNEFLRD